MARQRDAKGRYLPGKATKTPKQATPPPSSRPLRNHFILVCDGSGSMRTHREGAARLFNEQLDMVRGNNHLGQSNAVTVFHFGVGNTEVREVAFNAPADRISRFTWNSYPAEGDTPLYDAVIQAGNRALCDMDQDTSYVMVVLTDGEENASRSNTARDIQRFIQKQQATDRWTFVFLVPRGYKSNFVRLSGVHEGNVREWDNIERAREELTGGMARYFTARAAGARSSRNWFTTDLSAITPQTLNELKDVTHEVDMWTVDNESDIKSFVDYKSRGHFAPGRSFFEVMKKEKQFQDYKKLLIMDKATKRIYADNRKSVRSVCGFPDHGDVAIDPGNHANFVLLAQSMSSNRILPRGTKLAFWPNA